MWFVLRCNCEEESESLDFFRQEICKNKLGNMFVFTYDRMKRYEGQWHVEKMKLFPRHIFIENVNFNDQYGILTSYCESVKACKTKNAIFQVSSIEEEFLRKLCGESHHLKMSRGCIHKGMTYVTEGPLRGLEEQIRKIDRHKRLAQLEIPGSSLAEKCINIPAGLEIVEKN